VIHNAFSKHYVPELTIKPSVRDLQLQSAQASARAKLALANSKNQISIMSKQESDRTNAIKGVKL
jgi:hypothetical protein